MQPCQPEYQCEVLLYDCSYVTLMPKVRQALIELEVTASSLLQSLHC